MNYNWRSDTRVLIFKFEDLTLHTIFSDVLIKLYFQKLLPASNDEVMFKSNLGKQDPSKQFLVQEQIRKQQVEIEYVP